MKKKQGGTLKKKMKHTRETRLASQLKHQEQMQVYNEVKSGKKYYTEIAREHSITVYSVKKIVQEIQELIDYKIKGIPPKHPKVCNVCGGKVEYKRNHKAKSGYVYCCKKCGAWVGTHTINPRVALGELALVDVRRKRRELHLWFDNLWRDKKERKKYYDRLAKELKKDECHFSQMSMEELEYAEKIVRKWWLEKFDR